MTEVTFTSESSVELIQAAGSDNMVALAAWVSNALDSEERLKYQGKVKGLIKFLYRNRHMSPFEHGIFTFKVDVPLFVRSEWHRHRTMSYNEVSGRYTTMQPRFYIPSKTRPTVQKGKIGSYTFEPDDEVNNAVNASLKRASRFCWEEYENMRMAGAANEVARMCLPLNLMTQFYATVNPRNLMHFLSLRTDIQALQEIRDAATLVETYFKDSMPLTYAAYKEYS